MVSELSSNKAVADASNYDEAARFYREGRLDYSSDHIRKAAEIANLTSESTVLDLGCGPGTIANEVAQYCGRVRAVDISQAMLDVGQRYAPDNVTYIQGSDDDLSFIDSPVQLVTFGRSFHWMNRERTLEQLDAHVAPGGALAFLYVAPFTGTSPSHKWWLRVRNFANKLKIGENQEQNPLSKNAEREEILMVKSAFSKVTTYGTIEAYDWTFDNLMAWVRSRYRTNMAETDSVEDDVREGLRQVLAPYGKGPWRTYNQQRMVIAQRPD